MTSFRLYPVEQHWWSFNDYRAVLDLTRRFGAKKVLEFGPGSSTLSLLEGGAERIDACEDDPDWEAVHRARLVARFPAQVQLLPYTWSDPLSVKGLRRHYDLALVDGPRDHGRRAAVVAFCLRRASVVVVPTEEGDGESLRPELSALAAQFKRDIEIVETGPLAGAFAVITKRRA